MRHRIPQSIVTGGLIAGSPQSIVTGGLIQPVNRFAVTRADKTGDGLEVTGYGVTIKATIADPLDAEIVEGEFVDDLAVASVIADAV